MRDEGALEARNSEELVTMRDYVGTILAWLEARVPLDPLAAAVTRDIGPTLIGWVAHQMFHDFNRETLVPPSLKATRLKSRASEAWGNWSRLSSVALDKRLIRRSFAEGWQGEAALLAICLQPNSTRAFLPVARELRARGVETRFLFDFWDESSIQAAKSDSYQFHIARPLRRPQAALEVARTGARLRHLWADEKALSLLLESLGLSDHLRNGLASTLRRAVLSGVVKGEALHQALRSSPAQNTLFITRRAFLNSLLPSTHGNSSRIFFLQGLVPAIPPVRTTLDVDLAIAGGPLDLPYLLRCGVSPTNISLTGYPDYDSFPGLDKAECRRQYAQEKALDAARPWVVFTSQYRTPAFPHSARHENLKVVSEAANLHPNIQYIIKLHPRNESWNPSHLPPNVTLDRTFDTPRLIKAADVLVTYWSTTALEALLLGTPLIQLNATALPNFLTFPSQLQIPLVETAAELADAVGRAVYSPSVPTAETLTTWVGTLPNGRAAARCAESILDLISKRHGLHRETSQWQGEPTNSS